MVADAGNGTGTPTATAGVSVPGTPDIGAVKSWLGPAANSVTAAELELMLDAAVTAQAANHRIPAEEMPAPLVEAILRRVAKAVASKGIPLGMIVGDYEYQGPVTVRRWDAEINERENRYYIHAVA